MRTHPFQITLARLISSLLLVVGFVFFADPFWFKLPDIVRQSLEFPSLEAMGLSEHSFVSSGPIPPSLVCPICLDIFDDPVSCGGRPCQCTFCRSCLLSALEQRSVCPLDRHAICASDIMPNLLAQSLIDQLEVFCPNRCGGCYWTGAWATRAGHEEVCLVKKLEEQGSTLALSDL